uniref:Zinc finger and BTB domain containing 48 n=1 Tax=Tetraodon nigroviridis TaxID=99883 RepID=H3D4I1_TETNG
MPASESSHAQRVMSCLNQQRAAGKFCDAALNLGGGMVFLAHRNILACFSDLFQQSAASTTAPCTEMSLQQCPEDGLELLLNFVYTGELKLDNHNLHNVQHAASSLCVEEVLGLCQQFKTTSEDPAPPKRKRGRPRKPTSDSKPLSSVKEEKEHVSKVTDADAPTGSHSMASASTTTTRSGRIVKGPRRLMPEENPSVDFTNPDTSSKRPPHTPTEAQPGEPSMGGSDQPPGETEVRELQMEANNAGETAEEDEDAEERFEPVTEGTDEEYAPAEELSSSSASVPSAWERRAQLKRDKCCPICDKSFKSKYYLKVHNRRHTGERPFGCLKCGKRYFRKENLLVHEFRDCARVQKYTCVTCAATFAGKEELRLHVVSHTGDMPHKCSICPEQFMRKKSLTLHMMKAHGHPKPHACPECPKTFLTRTELRVHEAAKHRGEKPFVCEECGHRASSRNGLQMHIKAIHRNERPFVCSLCGHAFSQKNNLNIHLRIHSGERPYQCHLCGKTFRTQETASLDKHSRTHTGERPFACEVCEQRFTEKGALVRHKASKHEEGRPHCCHICNKTFKAREQLRVHLRRHKGMRKFQCSDCGYKFTRQAHLRRHVQVHKRTENYSPRQRKLRSVIVHEVDM